LEKIAAAAVLAALAVLQMELAVAVAEVVVVQVELVPVVQVELVAVVQVELVAVVQVEPVAVVQVELVAVVQVEPVAVAEVAVVAANNLKSPSNGVGDQVSGVRGQGSGAPINRDFRFAPTSRGLRSEGRR
jgi:hypothetical protein